jgi:hypothetical protein
MFFPCRGFCTVSTETLDWFVDYLTTLYQLRKLYSIKCGDRMVTKSEVYRTEELRTGYFPKTKQ